MTYPERIKVVANEPAETGPSIVACIDLDTGRDCVLKYWPTHRGADGEYENPARKMERGRCYRIGLRHSQRAGYDPEWMIREAEQIPDEVPPRIPTKDEFILAETCLKEAGESLRCQYSPEGRPFSESDHLAYATALFQGTMKMLSANCGKENK